MRSASMWVGALTLLLVVACTGDEARPGDPQRPPAPGSAALAVTTAALPDAEQHAPYAVTLASSGGAGAGRTWSLASGALPAGLELREAEGGRWVLAGVATQAGTFTPGLRVADAAGGAAVRELRLVVHSTLRFGPDALPEGVEGQPYEAVLQAQGGSGAGYTWEAPEGLPAGLRAVREGGRMVLAGTPVPGLARVRAAVVDSDDVRVERELALKVHSVLALAALQPVPARLTAGEPLQRALAVAGGVAPFRWSLGGDAAALGASVGEAAGRTATLHVALPAAGTFRLTYAVEDANGGRAEGEVALTVVPPLRFTTQALPAGQRGVAYDAVLEVEGGAGLPLTWTLVSPALPAGLTLTPDGMRARLAGTPDTQGAATVQVRVQDTDGRVAQASLLLELAANPPQLHTTALPAGATVGRAWEAVLEGASPAGQGVQWSVVGTLPPGVVLEGATSTTARLEGVPRLQGRFAFTLRLVDAWGSAERSFTVDVAESPELEVRARTLPRARVGRAFHAQVQARRAQDGVAGWAVVEGALPAGVALSAGPGGEAVLSGTPTAAGFHRLALQATDGAGRTARRSFALHVAPQRRWAVLAHNASFSGAGTVTVVDLNDATGATKAVVASGLGYVNSLQLSPDGGWLSIASQSSSGAQLWLADLRSGPTAAVRVADGMMPNLGRHVSFSPDSRWAVFQVQLGRNEYRFDSYAVSLEGNRPGTPRKLNGFDLDFNVGWSPDGTRFLMEAYDAKRFVLWDAAEDRVQVLDMSAAMTFIQWPLYWVPDGSGIVFGGGAFGGPDCFFHLGLGDPATARAVPITPTTPDFNPNAVRVSPDGARLAFDTYTGRYTSAGWETVPEGLATLDIGGVWPEPMRRVDAALGAPAPTSAEWSSDSRHLLLGRGSLYPPEGEAGAEFFVADVESPEAAPRNLTSASGLGRPTEWVRWAPDGAHVAYPSATGLSLVRAVGSMRVDALPGLPTDWRNYAFVPDGGRRIAYAAWPHLYLLDAARPEAERTPVQLDTEGRWEYAQWYHLETSPDLLYYAYNLGPRIVYWVDLAGPTPAAPVALVDLGEGILQHSLTSE